MGKIKDLIAKAKAFYFADPQRRKLINLLFILAIVPITVFATLTVQNLMQHAGGGSVVRISDQSGNTLYSTSNTNVFLDINLNATTQWILSTSTPSANSGFVKNAYAQEGQATTVCDQYTNKASCLIDSRCGWGVIAGTGFCSTTPPNPTKSANCGSIYDEWYYGDPSINRCVIPIPTPISQSSNPSTTLYFKENPLSITVGDTFVTDIVLDPGTNQVSFGEFDISYDSSKIQADEGSLKVLYADLTTQGFSDILAGPKYTLGHISVALSIGPDPKKAITKPTNVVRLRFKAIASGPTQISFEKSTSILSIDTNANSGGNVLATSKPLYLNISQSSSVTVPTPTPTPNTLKAIYIENKDTDGSTGGSAPKRIEVKSSADIAHIPWKLNDLLPNQTQASRIVQVTLIGDNLAVPFTNTINLGQPNGPTNILSKVLVSTDCSDIIPVRKECHLSALAYDTANVPMFNGINYTWGISSSNSIGILNKTTGNITSFYAQNIGTGSIWVIAQQGNIQVQKSFDIQVVNRVALLSPSPTLSPFYNRSFDLNNDGKVNKQDIEELLSKFGNKGNNLPEDLNKDGIVDGLDYNLLLSKIK